jgi:hypothetical protein
MTNSAACTRFLLLLLIMGVAGCDSAQLPSPTAPTGFQPPPTPQPNGHGEYVVDVTLSVAVFEMTPAGRTPVAGVQIWSSEQAMGVTDANGVFRVRPVWVCPCTWAPSVDADVTSVYWEKRGYEDPVGQPDSVFHLARSAGGWRDARISGDTRLEIELVKQ